jgi:sugar/nucleoside kinase (ribokinase family)
VERDPQTPHGVFVGLATLDIVQRVRDLPKRNTKVTALQQDIAAGGPALNAAVVFAKLGGRATLMTRLGDGQVSSLIRDDLDSHGVEVMDVAEPHFHPAVSTISIDDTTGDRQIVSTDARGGSDAPDRPGRRNVQGLSDALESMEPTKLVHLDGHHPDLALAAARWGKQLGVPRVVDAGRWKPVMRDLVALATDVVCSADFRVPDQSTALTSWIVSQGVDLAAVTNGPEPVQWKMGSAEGAVPVEHAPVVDTLGAGDFFHGAYSFARTFRDGNGRPVDPVACLQFASHIATMRCASTGTRRWLDGIGKSSLVEFFGRVRR